MNSVINFAPADFYAYFLILLRISGIFVTAPMLSMETVPRMVRVYMVVLISYLLYGVLPTQPMTPDFNVAEYFLLGIKEVMVGLFLGSVPRLMFAAIDLAGAMIGFTMGLSMANVVDPNTEMQTSIIASFETLVATLLFVVLDGHHIFFEALALSYQHVPVAGFTFNPAKIDVITRLTADVFVVGLKLGAPIIVALLLANAILGLMARSMPQINIFVVGFPLTILLGLVFLLLGMPYFTQAVKTLFAGMGKEVVELLKIMAK